MLEFRPADGAEANLDRVGQLFPSGDVVASSVGDDAAEIWTDFRLDAAGFGRMLLCVPAAALLVACGGGANQGASATRSATQAPEANSSVNKVNEQTLKQDGVSSVSALMAYSRPDTYEIQESRDILVPKRGPVKQRNRLS